ncbi:MAG: aminotransferase class I/II-fold pyridoxal phosphate-dependent enzyme [Patescibacteria group bacterium]|jgi:aspartate/methionine/tyrosine aminotransferase
MPNADLQTRGLVSHRAKQLKEEGAFVAGDAADRRAARGDIIVVRDHIGQLDFPMSRRVSGRIATSVRQRRYQRYCSSAGLSELRTRVAREFHETRGLPNDPEHILIGAGAKDTNFQAIVTVLDEGDRAAMFRPCYPQYRDAVLMAGGVPVALDMVDTGTGFSIDFDELESHLPTARMLILNLPHNPTGTVLSEGETRRLLDLLLKYPHVIILLDEVYSKILFDGEVFHSLSMYSQLWSRIIVVDGPSKPFLMTGSRLGWAWMPKELAVYAARALNVGHSCTAPFVQAGGLEALDLPRKDVELMVAKLQRRRDEMVRLLNGIRDFRCCSPQAAIYVYAYVGDLTDDADALKDRMLEEIGVSVLSGKDFDDPRPYLRFSLGLPITQIRVMAGRIKALLN